MTGEKNGVLNLAATTTASAIVAITTTATTATTEWTKGGSNFTAAIIIKTATTTATATTPLGVILIQIQVFHKENVGAPFKMSRQRRADKQLS